MNCMRMLVIPGEVSSSSAPGAACRVGDPSDSEREVATDLQRARFFPDCIDDGMQYDLAVFLSEVLMQMIDEEQET
jgi:hypothetical protein